MTVEKIGRYEIKSELGRGGMATVYHAYDPSFERDVAIKVLPRIFLHDPQFRVRFDREAKMIALLEHPAIVPVYDFGGEDEQPYIVMRYMSGGSLNERVDKGPLSLRETAQIVSRLAPALDAAHARDIIHRDLKPSNILFDRYGNAFLSDFGIARLAKKSGSTLTGGAILGTPAYMSPEQIQGEKTLDGRSDIYALGVLVYEMLTGQTPYRSDRPAKALMMHVLNPVPSILEDKPDLPIGCDVLIKKAMAKEPADRFATAGELASMLENIAHGDTATISPTSAETIVSQGETATYASNTATVVSTLEPATPASPIYERPAPEQPGKSRRLSIVIVTPIVLFLCLAFGVIGSMAYLGWQGVGPLAMLTSEDTATSMLPTATNTFMPLPPSNTPTVSPETTSVESATANPVPPATKEPTITSTKAPPTPTATHTLTPTPTPLVIGGADKIAFLNENDLWMANLDGSELTRLTEDGAIKDNLQWTPDGQAINYISGTCVYSVSLDSGRIDIITCLNFVDYLKSFQISPDGQRAAVSLDNQLYIISYDQEKLSEVKVRADLAALADCEHFSPYTRVFVKSARWSADGKVLAMIIFGVADDIGSADIVQVLPVDQCVPSPRPIDNFPPPRFRMPEYEAHPTIQNFGWDGFYLFALTSIVRNGGFGDLYVYNMELFKARSKINPINDHCCYRDPEWSPDGTHLLFAFQDSSQGANPITRLYLIPYGTVGTGAEYDPLPLPEFTDPKAKPYPILRPVR